MKTKIFKKNFFLDFLFINLYYVINSKTIIFQTLTAASRSTIRSRMSNVVRKWNCAVPMAQSINRKRLNFECKRFSPNSLSVFELKSRGSQYKSKNYFSVRIIFFFSIFFLFQNFFFYFYFLKHFLIVVFFFKMKLHEYCFREEIKWFTVKHQHGITKRKKYYYYFLNTILEYFDYWTKADWDLNKLSDALLRDRLIDGGS